MTFICKSVLTMLMSTEKEFRNNLILILPWSYNHKNITVINQKNKMNNLYLLRFEV